MTVSENALAITGLAKHQHLSHCGQLGLVGPLHVQEATGLKLHLA